MTDILYKEIDGCKFRSGDQLGGTCYMAAANAVFATSYAFEASNNPDVENYIRGYSDSHFPIVYGSTSCPMIPSYIGDLYNDMALLFKNTSSTLASVYLFSTVITLAQTNNPQLSSVMLHDTTVDNGREHIEVPQEMLANDYLRIYTIWGIFGRHLNMDNNGFDEVNPFSENVPMVGGGFADMHLLALLLASGSTPKHSRARPVAVDHAIDNYVTTTFPTVLTLIMRYSTEVTSGESNQLQSLQDKDFFLELYKVSYKIASRSNCIISGITLNVSDEDGEIHAFQCIPCEKTLLFVHTMNVITH